MTPNLRETRLEHLIAYGRVLLATCSLIAIYLDPTEPARFAQLTYNLLIIYAIYAVILAAWIGGARLVPARFGVVTHGVDLAAFIMFQYLTEGASSPFFTFFVFAFLVGVFRWHRTGLIWTAVIAIPGFIALGYINQFVVRDTAFELNRFIMRASYMTLVVVFLGYAARYDEKRRQDLSRLAVWSHSHEETLEAILAHVGAVLDAPRVLLIWREGDSADDIASRVAYWVRDGQFDVIESDEYWPPVDESFAGVDFLETGHRGGAATVVRADTLDIRIVPGTACVPGVRSRYRIERVLGMRLRFGHVAGWLLALDQPRATSDDLVIGELAAKQIAVALDNAYLSRTLQQHVRAEERTKVGRDLHDGVLQSLTGAGLRIEALRRRMDGGDIGRELGTIQQLVAAGQHDLRVFVNDLKSADRPGGAAPLADRLRLLREQARERWGIDLELELSAADTDRDRALAYDIYLIAHEAVVNAAKHGDASKIRLALEKIDQGFRLTIADNGRGFPFRGHYEHEALVQANLGPVSLRERVAALAGHLSIDSTGEGAHLNIFLPDLPRT